MLMTIPNQSSLAKAFEKVDAFGQKKESSLDDRVVASRRRHQAGRKSALYDWRVHPVRPRQRLCSLRQEPEFLLVMAARSFVGTLIGGRPFGWVPAAVLLPLLVTSPIVSAMNVWWQDDVFR